MTTIPDQRNEVFYDEPPSTKPPLIIIGPLAWIRDNLFRSALDTVLTILSAIAIVAVVTSFVTWTIGAANWFVIIFNLRQFTIGRYEPEYEWRLQLLVLIIAFIVGFVIATWGRISRVVVVLLITVVVMSFIVPTIISALVPLPDTYFLAANMEIVSGSSTEEVPEQVAFLGKAVETISVEIAYDLSLSDETLAQLHSFSDKAASALRNNAANRLEMQQDTAQYEAQLATDALTPRQREQVTSDLDKLEVPPVVIESYAVNQYSVGVEILNGDTLESLAETTLDQDNPAVSVTLPADGWYVLDKQIAGEQAGATLLRTHNIYPHLERSFTNVESEGVASGSGRVSQYVRMTDGYLTEAVRPQVDGEDVPMAIIIEHQYRGTGPLSDYLSLFLGPFLRQISGPLLLIVALAAAGYLTSRVFDRVQIRADRPRRLTQRAAIWLLIAIPGLLFVLIYGIGGALPLTDTRRWGGLLLTMMLTVIGIVGSFPLGVLLALGRRSNLPVISTVCTLYIEFVRGVPLITVLFMVQLLLPLANPALAEIDNVFRAMVAIVLFSAAYLAENVRGGLQAIPHGQEEAARALGLGGIQVTLFITLPQALRAVIPALVGQFISLFKDTSLVAIVGLLDLTGMSRVITTQNEFIGLRREAFLFIVVIYFMFSYGMSFVSRRLEESGSGAARRV